MTDADRAIPNELQRSKTTDFGHKENGGEFAFKITDISIDVFGDIFNGFRLYIGACELGFCAKNGALIFKLGKLEIKSASPGETRSEAFIYGLNLTGEAITSDDDLFAALIEVVKNIKEFFLGFFLADDELEIIYNEAVEGLVFLTKFFTATGADIVNELRVKIRDGGVEDFIVGVAMREVVADGLDEVSLAETRSTVEEERIKSRTG